jgi:23S rRNA (uracil1939-C5)-methyltransferase
MSRLTVGASLELSIEKPAAGGRMIARHNGQVVLVAGAIPGERVSARIERIGKGVAYATTTAVLDASPDRRATSADPACGGCVYAHVQYSRQLQLKSAVIADAFGRIGRIPLGEAPRVAGSPEEGYRMRARLHLQNGRAGFFREGSHTLCDARATRQLLPDTFDAVDELTARLRNCGPAVQEIEVSENVDASERAFHLEGPAAAGVVAQDPDLARATAEPWVHDRLELEGRQIALRRHVLAFFQGNRFLLRDLVRHVIGQLDSAPLLDLYAGVGLFAVAAAARGTPVTAVEGDPVAAADLEANAKEWRGLVTPVHQAVESLTVASGKPPGAVIVDPPRTGLSPEALQRVVALSSPSLVYVSCDVATLARDARRLLDAGYLMRRIDAFDLFPNTPHVETVVVFGR